MTVNNRQGVGLPKHIRRTTTRGNVHTSVLRSPGSLPLSKTNEDDRHILSGTMHVLKVGCRWVDCPPEYGPHKRIYNRFNRLERTGNLAKNIRSGGRRPEPPEQGALDSSHIKAHRCAGGGKRMARP